MKIGIPRETKAQEHRVGITPGGVRELVSLGNEVTIQASAGITIDFTDDLYEAAGARVVPSAQSVFESSELIVKVKEPTPFELSMVDERHTLFCYLHLAPDRDLTRCLMESGCTAIAYETVTADDGTLPLLTPMSQVAGRLSALVAARFLTVHQGGRGVLFSGMPGVAPAKVVILGAGNVGEQAAVMSMGMGAQVVVMDRSVPRLQHLERHYGGRLQTVFASRTTIEHHIRDAHVVIGAVLVPGAEAPKVLHREQLSMMKKGAVLVDVAIDQGGCFETSRETTHEDPVYEVDGIVHYCVPNMPGGVARTSTTALSNTTLPVIEKLASMGWREALRSDPHLMNGLNVHRGMVTCKAVADAHGFPYVDPLEALEKSP